MNLLSITVNQISNKDWITSIFVFKLNKTVNFLIDTGSDITCMPSKIVNNELLHNLKGNCPKIFGPSGKELKLKGILKINLYFLAVNV